MRAYCIEIFIGKVEKAADILPFKALAMYYVVA